MSRPFKKSLAFINSNYIFYAFLTFPRMQYSQPTPILLDFITLISYEGTSLVAWWSELLTTNHEVPGSIPGFTMCVFP